MLTTDILNQEVLGEGWEWDDDDEVLFVRTPCGPDMELIVSFNVTPDSDMPEGYEDPIISISRDKRNNANERIDYANWESRNTDEDSVYGLLTDPAAMSVAVFAQQIEEVRNAPCDHSQCDVVAQGAPVDGALRA